MKTITRNIFLTFYNNKLTNPLCAGKLKFGDWWRWSSSLGDFLRSVISMLRNHARQVLRDGRVAVSAHLANERHLVGDMFLVLGIGAFFFHQIFSPIPNDTSWYYTNWFYFFHTLRPFLMLLLWSVTSYLYSSSKSGLIIFTVLHSAGWLGIFHYSFFVVDFTTFHTFPAWDLILLALSFGIGFILATEHLVYVWNHKRKGNHCRLVGIAEMDLAPEKKEPLLKQLAQEYRQLNKKY